MGYFKTKSLDLIFAQDSRPITTFRDQRVASLQAIIDFVFSNAGRIKDFNSADITEFFRLGEIFSKGYDETRTALGKAVNFRLLEDPLLNEKVNSFISDYSNILMGLESQEKLKHNLEKISEIGINRPLSLFNGNYMNPKPNTTLFEGKKVLVTGSETGIGRAVALEFARRKAKVILHYPNKRFERGALSAVDLITESGIEAKAFSGDFRFQDQIQKFSQSAINYFKGVDILVNNAGITLNKSFEDVIFQDFDDVLSVNLRGMYFVTQKASEYMKKVGKGIIINIASNHAIRGMAGHSVYAATKGAIISLTRQLAMELSPTIRVNSINPGWVAGTNHFRLLPEINFSEYGQNKTPQGIDTPENFAYNVVNFAANDSNSITGQNISIDRGLSSCMSSGKECTQVGDKPWGAKYLEE